MKLEKSRALFSKADRYIPGGVNSPVRAFKSVNMDPLFIERASGSRIYDADGNEYIDYVCSWGPLILGHAHPLVVSAVQEAAEKGMSYGACTELEIEMAALIVEAVPSIEKIRMVNSGTEATMSALRLARGYTGRNKIIKFGGCYHGHVDSLLIKAGSGALTFGVPDSPGVSPGMAQDTIILPYNDLSALEETFGSIGDEIAAIIVEPVAGNMGVIPPAPGFLQGLRQITERHGALLIFDEVITGFRVGYSGAQGLYGITHDLTCLGKIIGGGLPVGAYGGRAEIMEHVAPLGPVYQAGTLSGNPLAMSAGIATLKLLKDHNIYRNLEERARLLAGGLLQEAQRASVPIYQTRVGSLFCMFFTGAEVDDYESAARSDTRAYTTYFKNMLENGVYLAPSQFEAGFVSSAHSLVDVGATIEAARKAFRAVSESRG